MTENKKVEVVVNIHLMDGQVIKTTLQIENTVSETVQNWISRFSDREKQNEPYVTYYKNCVTAFKYGQVVSIDADLGSSNNNEKKDNNFSFDEVSREVNQIFNRWYSMDYRDDEI